MFILLFGILPAISVGLDRSFVDTTPSQMILASLILAVVMISPAVGYLAGIRWCRYLFRAFLVVTLIVWTSSPLAQHAIDRHLPFWCFWAMIEAFLVVLVWRVFADPKKTELIQSSTAQALDLI